MNYDSKDVLIMETLLFEGKLKLFSIKEIIDLFVILIDGVC